MNVDVWYDDEELALLHARCLDIALDYRDDGLFFNICGIDNFIQAVGFDYLKVTSSRPYVWLRPFHCITLEDENSPTYTKIVVTTRGMLDALEVSYKAKRDAP